jgi:hypothetical protein
MHAGIRDAVGPPLTRRPPAQRGDRPRYRGASSAGGSKVTSTE